MAVKQIKDFIFCIDNILDNLEMILRRINIKPRGREFEDIVNTLKDIVDRYLEEERRNRGLHRLTDKILDEFSQIVSKAKQTFENALKLFNEGRFLQELQNLEKDAASCIRMLSKVDVLSLEIDECNEMRWWKENYEKIRTLVYYLVWLTYFLLMYMLCRIYRNMGDTVDISDELIKRSQLVMLIHRALMR